MRRLLMAFHVAILLVVVVVVVAAGVRLEQATRHFSARLVLLLLVAGAAALGGLYVLSVTARPPPARRPSPASTPSRCPRPRRCPSNSDDSYGTTNAASRSTGSSEKASYNAVYASRTLAGRSMWCTRARSVRWANDPP